MINLGEIQRIARQAGVRDLQIEKDYILSWILYGISNHNFLSKILAFKGGTVLKKVYFEDYRFSEDLDFTLLDEKATNEQVFGYFSTVFEFIKEEANIPLLITDNKEHGDSSINFYISYIGPLGGQEAKKSVKIDISRSEKLEFAPIMKNVFLGYTDLEKHQLLCYSLDEILVEKMRSVMQRMQARDFYDIWYLLEIHGMDIDFLLNEFRAKCESKKLNSSDFHNKLEKRIPQYKGRWEKSIASQIQELPNFNQVLREVMRHLKNLEL